MSFAAILPYIPAIISTVSSLYNTFKGGGGGGEGGGFFSGNPEKRENVSRLLPEQEKLYNQLIKAGMGTGAGGAFGESADYYRNLLSNNPQDLEAFQAPMMRQFYESIIPNLSEQFAGMGAGGLSSSGFRNAATQSGVDLAERLGQMRANLRQNAAQGLMNIGQAGLQPYSQNMTTEQGSPGMGGYLGDIAGKVLPGLIDRGIDMFSNYMNPGSSGSSTAPRPSQNSVGANSSPYGNQYQVPARRPLPNWSNSAR